MLLTLIPLFDENIAVSAYSVFSQKDNMFLNPLGQVTGVYDGATYVQGIEAVNSMGIETLSGDKMVFVPVSNVSIFSNIEEQCKVAHVKVALLIDRTVPPIESYVKRLKELKAAGFKIAIRKLAVSEFQVYAPILELVDFVFLNNKKIAIDKAKMFFSKLYPAAKLIAGNIDTMDTFEALKKTGGYHYYEGEFYRLPVTKGSKDIAPSKITQLELLKIVNNPDFELNEAADIIGRDTALTLSLLQMVNRVVKTAEITTIRHAAAMLGQKELKKWINTAVVGEISSDQPNEITRLTLLRARFAEDIAGFFGLKMQSEELFLMGLFSMLDVILDKPMSEALEMIHVSNDIKSALISKEGKFAPVYEFILAYEQADWSEVSRVMLLKEIDADKVYQSYLDTLNWYRKTILGV
ncbi:MAG: HDOD domain-containing protein [Lachnospiraceae bacterium]|nr:HDOD domain-containing protein [Lachnospiraceae bacterium]